MAPDSPFKSFQGKKSEPLETTIEADAVLAFARATGVEVTPGEAIRFVPSTFLTVYRSTEFTMLEEIGIPLSRVLHADQEYSFTRPVQIGERLSYQTELVQVLEKRNLCFLIFETRFHSTDSTIVPVAVSRTSIVHISSGSA